jgi:DNA-binding transcriptional LysR family regulator
VDPALNIETIWLEPLVAVLPLSHPLADKHRISLQRLKSEPWIIVDTRTVRDSTTKLSQPARPWSLCHDTQTGQAADVRTGEDLLLQIRLIGFLV